MPHISEYCQTYGHEHHYDSDRACRACGKPKFQDGPAQPSANSSRVIGADTVRPGVGAVSGTPVLRDAEERYRRTVEQDIPNPAGPWRQ